MIPLIDLKAQYREIKKEVDRVIGKVSSSGWYILGEQVERFEAEFARYIGAKYAVGVASGTDAIALSLQSLGVGSGDEVLLATNAYPVAFAITTTGAVPRLVDIDSDTFNIDPKDAERRITNKTKALIAVHLYGQPANLALLKKICQNRGLYLIEDCAQAHGAKNKDKKVGTLGDIGCFSFYPTKNLGAYGDGGMAVTNNKNLAEKVRALRQYGEATGRYESSYLGRNSRLDELQAAILRVKLKYLDEWNRKRREKANLYRKLLAGVSQVKLPKETANLHHVYHLFVIRAQRRDALQEFLKRRGILTGIHYPKPIHLQPSFAFLGHKKGDFPEAEKSAAQILSLPLYPELKNEDIGRVCSEIKNFYAGQKA